jgi:hypothetical protein
MEQSMPESNIADDMTEGTPAIAAHIGKTERQTNYLLETKRLPAFKIGSKWHMRKSTYRAYIERLEAESTKVA